jgi:hypothetical protein
MTCTALSRRAATSTEEARIHRRPFPLTRGRDASRTRARARGQAAVEVPYGPRSLVRRRTARRTQAAGCSRLADGARRRCPPPTPGDSRRSLPDTASIECCFLEIRAAAMPLLPSMRMGAPGVGGRAGNALLLCRAARVEVARERSAAFHARRWHWGGGRTAPGGEQPRCDIRRPRRGHVRAAARCRRAPSLTRDTAGVAWGGLVARGPP